VCAVCTLCVRCVYAVCTLCALCAYAVRTLGCAIWRLCTCTAEASFTLAGHTQRDTVTNNVSITQCSHTAPCTLASKGHGGNYAYSVLARYCHDVADPVDSGVVARCGLVRAVRSCRHCWWTYLYAFKAMRGGGRGRGEGGGGQYGVKRSNQVSR